MKIINRLSQYIEYKNISLNSFDISIGASNGYIGKQIKKQASIGGDIIEKIVNTYTDLSLIWLITGEGEMLKNELKKEETKPVLEENTVINLLKEQLKDKERENKELNRRIWELEKEVSELSTRLQKYGIHNSTVSELIIEKK